MINLDYRSRVPIYDQIVNGIIKLRTIGVLKADDKLPSVRQLAGELRVNPNTVQKAYKQLEDEGLILRVSEINALRREAIEAYSALGEREHIVSEPSLPKVTEKEDPRARTALVYRAKNLPREDAFYAYFDIVFLPLAEYLQSGDVRVKGVQLPGAIFETEVEKLAADLARARAMGAEHVLCGNYGHLPMAKKSGMHVHGDFRLNITNSTSAELALASGFESLILSPELTQAQSRDIGGSVRNIVYGRLPIMLLEKCAATDLSGCKACASDRAELCDRRGTRFPILREEPHRNLLFNSVPTYAADRPPRGGQHFLFTTEKPHEMLAVLDAYEKRLPPEYDIRRIKEK